MRIMVIFGTRPEVIKLAPVILELRSRPDHFQTYLLATAQHRHLLDQMLNLFAITPDRDLDIMSPGQSLESLSSRVIERVSRVYSEVHPDLVMIQGDTTTAMASALAAFYQKIPAAHVEAGLRTKDPCDPFPEEMNRRLIGSLCTLHFTPTAISADNLRREGIPAEAICQTGNTVVDALAHIERRGIQPSRPWDLPPGSRLLLVTSHRRENFGPPLEGICRALSDIAGRFPDVEIVFPVHPNPRVRETVHSLLSDLPRIHLVEPLDYVDLLGLLKRCHLVLTDSGGIQEEAPSFGKPVLVLRRTTERPEGVLAGIAHLVGTEREAIVSEASRLLDDPDAYRAMVARENPYGDGRAAARIADFLVERGPFRRD